MPEIFLKARPLRTARGRLVSGLPASNCSVSSVRRTRWGTPSTWVVRIVPLTSLLRYTSLTASGTGASAVIRKRVPMAMPAAP